MGITKFIEHLKLLCQPQVAKSKKNYRFAITTKKEVLEELKYDGCAVIVYKAVRFTQLSPKSTR